MLPHYANEPIGYISMGTKRAGAKGQGEQDWVGQIPLQDRDQYERLAPPLRDETEGPKSTQYANEIVRKRK